MAVTHGRLARGRALCPIVCALALIPGPAALAQGYANDKTVGIEEKLGQTIPLDLTFNDEQGRTVTLGGLITRPTLLTLIYFRCPSICSPLMEEVAHTVDELDMLPGVDYDLITVSFDDTETPETARTGKASLLGRMKKKVPPESWRFLTGKAANIARLTDAVGFRFRRDRQDFVHAGTVIFLSKEGKIVRYLGGLEILPADMKMALIDAAEGRPRTLMQKIQRLCYSFDPEGKTYVFKVNRIILFVTLAGLGVFLLFLLVRRRPKPVDESKDDSKDASQATAERSP